MSIERSELYRKGDSLRRELLGEAAYARNNRNYSDPVMGSFLEVCTESVFGALWARDGLDLKTRSLVCCVADAVMGCEPELEIHLHFALRQGWTKEELTEALLHLLGYVGAPLTRTAMLVARKVFAEIEAESGK